MNRLIWIFASLRSYWTTSNLQHFRSDMGLTRFAVRQREVKARINTWANGNASTTGQRLGKDQALRDYDSMSQSASSSLLLIPIGQVSILIFIQSTVLDRRCTVRYRRCFGNVTLRAHDSLIRAGRRDEITEHARRPYRTRSGSLRVRNVTHISRCLGSTHARPTEICIRPKVARATRETIRRLPTTHDPHPRTENSRRESNSRRAELLRRVARDRREEERVAPIDKYWSYN